MCSVSVIGEAVKAGCPDPAPEARGSAAAQAVREMSPRTELCSFFSAFPPRQNRVRFQR